MNYRTTASLPNGRLHCLTMLERLQSEQKMNILSETVQPTSNICFFSTRMIIDTDVMVHNFVVLW